MNNDYLIVVDASCDYPKEELLKNNIKVIPMEYSLNDKMLVDNGFVDDKELYALYNSQRNNDTTKTSQITPFIYQDFFKKILDEGKSVLYICLSSGLSGTYNSSLNISRQLNEEYKDKNVKVMSLDSLQATCGENLIIERAIKNLSDGKSIDDNYNDLKDSIKNIHTYFVVPDLDYLKRGGRISPLSATFGKMLKIRPVLKIDEIGKLQTIDKMRGDRKALEHLYSLFKSHFDEKLTKSVWLVHSDAPDKISELKKMITADYPDIEVHVTLESPIIAAHTGPDFFAINSYGK